MSEIGHKDMEAIYPSLIAWARWVLLTEVGFFGGWYVAAAISTSLIIHIGLAPASLMFSGMWGASLGGAQWLELSRHQLPSKPSTWIIGTSTGFSIGLAVAVLLGAATVEEPLKALPVQRAISALLVGAGVGLGVGIAQCRALRLRGVDARMWKVVNTVGLAIGCLAGSVWADFHAGGWGTRAGMPLLAVAAGLGLGGASGWSLQSIIRRHRVRQLIDVF
jgi:hypothetical protein